MKIEEVLQHVGLSEAESKVYLATLELGSSTVTPISKKSGVKRTYCYDILADLMRKGVVSYYEKNNRRRYTASDPKRLKEKLLDRLHQFDEALPELRSLFNNSADKPSIRFYAGREEVKSIYSMLPHAKRIDSMGSPESIYLYLGSYFDEIARKVVRKNRIVRELVPEKNADAPYLKELDSSSVRYLPGSGELATDLIIFDDKVALISYAKDIHAVLIESSGIVATQRYMFDLIWEMAGDKDKHE